MTNEAKPTDWYAEYMKALANISDLRSALAWIEGFVGSCTDIRPDLRTLILDRATAALTKALVMPS